MILLLDNYDSFSFNLYQMIGSIEPDIKVMRSDSVSVDEIERLNPKAVIISPGPGRPEEAGVCIEAVRQLGSCFPILGVCLGHQAICAAYGASVSHAKSLMHGKQSIISVDTKCLLFAGCPETMPAARYHSLAAEERTLPRELIVAGRSEDGEIMAVYHRDYDVFGVQFHPESIMTPDGITILANFISIAEKHENNRR